MSSLLTIPVSTASHSYSIFIKNNLIKDINKILYKISTDKRRIFIITDKKIAELHLKNLLRALGNQNIIKPFILSEGEKYKNWASLQRILNYCLSHSIRRADIIIALGGGVIGDITGLAASLLLRGVIFVQIPTTLIAQIDSSIGGKTAINTKQGKNLIGTFYQPSLVLIDPLYLKTLPLRHLKAGYAELIKYALIQDNVFFKWLQKNHFHIFNGNTNCLKQAIAKCCKIKASIIAQDEKDRHQRLLLNLGHSFGHALESLLDYNSNKLLHGEAVSIGIVFAFSLSVYLGLCPEKENKIVKQHLDQIGLPTQASLWLKHPKQIQKFIYYLQQDKKSENQKLTLILVKGIGKAFIQKNISVRDIEDFIYFFLGNHL
ncbi:MAG: 3-dehydroquinate synthase [Alphaproteobacteria bacterium]|nr:3-dehydroquinate synthase [Alphaproteobacteria bacterium]